MNRYDLARGAALAPEPAPTAESCPEINHPLKGSLALLKQRTEASLRDMSAYRDMYYGLPENYRSEILGHFNVDPIEALYSPSRSESADRYIIENEMLRLPDRLNEPGLTDEYLIHSLFNTLNRLLAAHHLNAQYRFHNDRDLQIGVRRLPGRGRRLS
jgi:hypothetical protein